MSSGVRGGSPAYFQPSSWARSDRLPGSERGRGRQRQARESRMSRWAAATAGRTPDPKAWACKAGGSRPGMGSGGDADGRGLGGGQARRPRPGPRHLQRGCPTAEQQSELTDAGQGSPAASATARGRGGRSPPPLSSQPSRPAASPSGPGCRPAGGSRELRAALGAPEGPRVPAPPPPSVAAAAQGRPAGTTARGASAARASNPRPRPSRPSSPAQGPAPPAAAPDLRSCGHYASGAPRAACWWAGGAYPAGGARRQRRVGPPLPAALGLED